MKAALAVAGVVTVAGLIGLAIGPQAAQTVGILAALSLITALAVVPKKF